MTWTNPLIFAAGIAVGWGMARLLPASQSSQPLAASPPEAEIPQKIPADAQASSAPPPSINPAQEKVSQATIRQDEQDEQDEHGDQSLAVPNDDVLQTKLEQLELAYQMALEMGKFKAGFLARTSHELRSPLNSIMSLQQLILTDLCDSPEEEREFVSQSYAASQKLLALLNETTNVSKLEEGTITLHLEPVSLDELLSELESLTHLQAMNRNLRLTMERPSPDITVMGDRRWLRQVLMNLVTSAIYAMNEGTIRVSAQQNEVEGNARIDIEDERSPTDWSEPIHLLSQSRPESPDGEAISKETVMRAIATDDALSSVPPTGLNLVITQIMMEKMNGKLSILSAPAMQPDGTDPKSDTSTPGTHVQCVLPLAKP